MDIFKPLGEWKGFEGWWRKIHNLVGDKASHLDMVLAVCVLPLMQAGHDELLLLVLSFHVFCPEPVML